MDLTTLTDEELIEHRAAVLDETERRQRLADAPAQVASIATRYVEDGGDPATLVAAVTPEAPA